MILDPWGNPMQYHVLRQHPGAFGAFVMLGYEFDAWPAAYVLHDYKRYRPAQQRGIPEANPALPLFALLRSFTLAVLNAAEAVAEIALVAETMLPPDPDEMAGVATPMSKVELQRRLMTFLPQGYKLNQVKSEQPTTTYSMFTDRILREICRCMNLPLIFASLDAERVNMSTRYVITQPFAKAVGKDRSGYNRLNNRVLDMWLTEAIKIPGYIVKNQHEFPKEAPRQWFWPSLGTHDDPAKVANASATELVNGLTTIPREYAKHGLDWEAEQELAARSLGLTVAEYQQALRQKLFATMGTPPPVTLGPGDPNPDDDAEETNQTGDEDDDDQD